MPLRIAGQQASRFRQRGFVMQAGEDVEHFAPDRCRMTNAVGGDQGKLHAAREIQRRLVAGFFVAIEVALQLDEDVAAAEDTREAIHGFRSVAVFESKRERTFVAAGKTNQAAGELGKIVERGGRLFAGLRNLRSGAQLHACDEAAEILIALAGFHEEGVTAAILRGDFGADMRANRGLLRSHVKSRRTVEAIDVGQRHRWAAMRRGDRSIVLRNTGAAQKTEGGAGMQLDVRRGRHTEVNLFYCLSCLRPITVPKTVTPAVSAAGGVTEKAGRQACRCSSLHNGAMAKFVCNICGAGNAWSGEPFEREKRSCAACGSNQRERALIGVLAMELFGTQLALPHFPRVKSWRGLGTSDSPRYATRLAEVFDYRNTFFDREPRLDLARLNPADTAQAPGQYDFIVSSEVFEHVAPPLEEAFHNAWALLKPGGVLVFTVPYHLDPAIEHFPDLNESGLADVSGRMVLVNRNRNGQIQVHENLNFHLSGAGPALEMRICSEEMLRNALSAAGFSSVKIHGEAYRPFGIVPAESWALPIAARKGPYACSIDAMRDVIGEWSRLRTSLAESRAYRVARKLGLK